MTPSMPTRHPEQPRAIPGAIRVFATAFGVGKPTEQQWRQLGRNLLVGDEPMDRLVDWMSSAGMQTARPMFDRALRDGIANVPEAPEPLREFFERVEATPAWVDQDKLRRAQQAMRMGGADGMYIARDVALLGGYQFSGFNKTLLRTGALEKGSNQRFAETMQWALDLLAEDLTPTSVGYRSTIRVRLIHAFVRRHVSRMPDWQPDDWGVPVNQTDMAATLVGALIAPSAGGIGMGLFAGPADFDAIAHFTRYVGWLIGVHDEWLPVDFGDGIRVLAHTLAALSNPDESTRQLAMPMVEDPLRWHYRHLSGVRRRIARSQHLSVTSAFLGPRAMRTLGLPPYVVPWYPLLRLPVNAARSVLTMTVPAIRDRAAARGYQEMEALLRTMIGADSATIGAAAAHVGRAA